MIMTVILVIMIVILVPFTPLHEKGYIQTLLSHDLIKILQDSGRYINNGGSSVMPLLFNEPTQLVSLS